MRVSLERRKSFRSVGDRFALLRLVLVRESSGRWDYV